MAEFRPASLRAIAMLERDLRPADVAELDAAQGRPIGDVVVESYMQSPEVWAWWSDDDELIAVFGYVPLGPILTTMAAPWMLGTPLVERHAGALIRSTRHYVAAWRERYPLLVNFVDARNTASIRYLRRVGFTLDEPAPFGAAGLPFHRFHMGLAD